MKKVSFKVIGLLLAVLIGFQFVPLGSQAAAAYERCPVAPAKSVPAGLQADITFPDYMNYVDDTLLMNGTYSFKSYAGQGELYVTCGNGLKDVDFFVNGIRVNLSAACKHNGQPYKVNIARATVNGINTIQVANYAPESGTVSIKIPYPTVTRGSAASVGMDQDKLNLIDTLINKDIQYGFTSAQLAIIKDGVLVKNTAYGRLDSYNQDGTRKTDSPKVTTNTLYDLASNTKMYATNYALQKLVSEGKIGINDKITKYFPDFRDGDSDPIKGKASLTLRNLMEHQGGFPADPQYHNDKFNQATQKPNPNVTNPLFSQDKATTLQMILKTPLSYVPGSRTLYSDVDYMLLGFVVEKVTGKPLDEYVEETFYQPLGLNHIVYNPLQKGFSKNDCAATELNGNTRDGAISFRNIRTYTLQGEVHDEKAFYAMGGVSGHAGLFASAGDLAKLCQVMLNGGGYGGTRFFDANTIDQFTKRKDALATWGLGWWREGDYGRPWYFGVQSSRDTIGHQGWTGTLTMIDPSADLVVVLLTNKINSPLIDNTKNANMFYGNKFTTSTLGTIPSLIYDAIAHTGDEAMNAGIAQMVPEKLKLYHADDYQGGAVLDATLPLVDLVITRAEEKKTQETLAYAKQAVAQLTAAAQGRADLSAFNKRISALEKRIKDHRPGRK